MEPWLRSGEADVSARHADIITGIEQALYLLEIAVRDVPEEALWWEPAPRVASIGARIQHLIGASRRLHTYAFDAEWDPEVLAEMAEREWVPAPRPKEDVLREVRTVFEATIEKIRTVEEGALDEPRPVGRRRIPVRRSAILHHLAEHAAHHVGQIFVLIRLWEAHDRSVLGSA
jgi:uncharacterized damage-inducible protein DinB